MERFAFTLEVRPEQLPNYLCEHESVWPELLAAISDAGIRNYSLFLCGSRVFGYLEGPDLAASWSRLAGEDVYERWQQFMEPFLVQKIDGEPNALEEFFHLP